MIEHSAKLALKFRGKTNMTTFYKTIFPDFIPEQHEALALRCIHKKELVFTLYVLEKGTNEQKELHRNQLPVKKLQSKQPNFPLLLKLFQEIHFTMGTGNK